jgi:hypothetical protein
MAARLERGRTMMTAWYGVGGGLFWVWGALTRCWGPRGGVGQAEGGPEAAVHSEEPVEGGGRLTASAIFGAR